MRREERLRSADDAAESEKSPLTFSFPALLKKEFNSSSSSSKLALEELEETGLGDETETDRDVVVHGAAAGGINVVELSFAVVVVVVVVVVRDDTCFLADFPSKTDCVYYWGNLFSWTNERARVRCFFFFILSELRRISLYSPSDIGERCEGNWGG